MLLVHLLKDPLFVSIMSFKTRAYMAVGKLFMMAVNGIAAYLVNQAGCGLTANSENPLSMAHIDDT